MYNMEHVQCLIRKFADIGFIGFQFSVDGIRRINVVGIRLTIVWVVSELKIGNRNHIRVGGFGIRTVNWNQ